MGAESHVARLASLAEMTGQFSSMTFCLAATYRTSAGHVTDHPQRSAASISPSSHLRCHDRALPPTSCASCEGENPFARRGTFRSTSIRSATAIAAGSTFGVEVSPDGRTTVPQTGML
jgi:hypothetical protein